MKSFFIILITFFCSLSHSDTLSAYELEPVQEDRMAISADHVDYQKDVLKLNGNAAVEHELGILAADLMTLHSQSKKKGVPFDYLQMEGHVDLSLNEGGRLCCSKGMIDYEALMGTFLSGAGQERVVYTENCHEKKNAPVCIVIESLKMQLNLLKTDKEKTDGEKIVIGTIQAEGDVVINYDGRFSASSDHAVFQRKNAKEDSKELLPGLITLSSSSPALCRVTNREGDEILSSDMMIETTQRQLTFTFPKGSFKSVGSASAPVEFSAKKLVWNDLTSTLTLSENVEVFQLGLGKLQTTQDVQVVLIAQDGKKVPRSMETYGDALLTYTDQDTELDHVLQSYGSLRIDHQKMETKLISPENADGTVGEGLQVFFHDAKGDIYADRAFIKYDCIDQKIVPIRIVLQGNVKIANNLEQSAEDQTLTHQYILADRVDFIPHTKEMIFKSGKGKRVLLFDKANNLEVSAPGLKIIRDKATRKETVQGLGDVRFSFVESEFDQLRQRFSFDKPPRPEGLEDE